MPVIRIEGDVLHHHSLAYVNREIALGLEEAGWTVVVRQNNDRDQIDRYDDPRVPRIYEMIERNDSADVVLRHSFPPKLDVPAEGCPVVFIQPWEYGSMPREWRYQWSALADKIIVPSKYVKDIYEKDKLGVPVSVIANGVSDSYFDTEQEGLDFKLSGVRVLYVGGSIQRKGPDLVLDAIRKVSADTDISLIFKDHPFYQSDYSTRLDQAKIKFEYIRNFMSPADMPKLYRSADIFLFPTRGEGFGLPLLEAMASGLLCVSVDHSGCGDFFDNEVGIVCPSVETPIPGVGIETVGQTTVFEPQNVDQGLREAIKSLPNFDRTKVIKRAQEYTWDRVVGQYDQELRELIGITPAHTQKPSGKRAYALVPSLLQEGKIHDVLRIEPDNPGLYISLANEAIGKGKHEKAVGYYEKAWKYNKHPAILFNKAASRLAYSKNKKDIELSVDEIIESYRMNPNPKIKEFVSRSKFPGYLLRKLEQVFQEKERKTLSVVMIVRNEEHNIERAINSIRGIADEICVVDTGSTDRTVNILRGLGVDVEERPDLFDFETNKLKSFADARNASIEKASGDMIMWLDADDEVPHETASIIRTAIDSGVDALSIPVQCPQADPSGKLSNNVVRHYRVFPNDSRIRFSGRIHEQVAPSIAAAGYMIQAVDAPILHHGYKKYDNLSGKYERNLSFLLEEDDGQSDWIGFNLMTTYLLMGELEKAKEVGEERLGNLKDTEAHAGKYISTLAACHIATGDIERGEELCWLGINKKLNLVEQYFNLGGIYMNRIQEDPTNIEKAKEYMTKALEMPLSCSGGAIDSDAGFRKPLEALIQLSSIEKNYEQTREYLLQLMSKEYDVRYHKALVDIYRLLEDHEAVKRNEKQLLGSAQSDVEERTKQAFDLLEKGETNDAIRILESICGDIPGQVQALTNLAIGYSRAERYQDAMEILEKVFLDYASYEGLYCLTRCARGLKDWKKVLTASLAGCQLNPSDPMFHFELSTALLELGNYENSLLESQLATLTGYEGTDILDIIAESNFRLGHLDIAIQECRKKYLMTKVLSPKMKEIYHASIEEVRSI